MRTMHRACALNGVEAMIEFLLLAKYGVNVTHMFVKFDVNATHMNA